MRKTDLNELLAQLKQVLTTDPKNAFTMPGAFYTSDAVLELEREFLFRKKWICVARESEIPEPGCYLATEVVGEPIVIVRNNGGSIKALSNVCRHRAMPLTVGSGKTKRFTCSYHAWTYNLDGDLVRAPGVADHHRDFIRDCRLPEFPCEIWHGFVFVNLDIDAESFIESETVRQIEPMIKNMHIEDMQILFSEEQEWDVNWKCLVENFLEGYHLSTVHRNTLAPYTPTELSEHFDAGEGFLGFYSGYPKDAPSRGVSHPDVTEVEKQRSLMLGIAPSSVFGISGFKVTYNLIQPITATRLRTRIGMIGIPPQTEEENRLLEAGVDLFKRTFAEDEEQLVNLMRGLNSRAYSSSKLAKPAYEGTIWDFYHYLANNLSLAD